jgi:hypothetical protein
VLSFFVHRLAAVTVLSPVRRLSFNGCQEGGAL